MTFKEIKQKEGFKYTVRSWYGEIVMKCKDKLNAEILDSIFMDIIKNKNIKGILTYKSNDKEIKICYNWIKNEQWNLNDDENIIK